MSMLGASGCSNSDSSNSDDPRANSTQTDAGYYLVEGDTLTIAVTTDNAPYQSKPEYEPTGFTIDLLKALAEEMGLGCNFVEVDDSDTAVQYVVSGTGEEKSPLANAEEPKAGPAADLAASNFLVETFDAASAGAVLTDSYVDIDLALAVHEDDGYTKSSQLKKATIGVVEGSDAETWARDNFPKATIKTYADDASAFTKLNTQDIDAVVANQQMAEHYAKATYQDIEVIERYETDRSFAFVANADNEALVQAVNTALAALKDNGTYAEIYDNWFGPHKEPVENPRVPLDSDGADTFNNASGL